MKSIVLFFTFLLVVLIGGFFVSKSFYDDAIFNSEKAAETELQMITGSVSEDLNYILSDTGRDLNMISRMFNQGDIPTKKELMAIFEDFYSTNSYMMNLGFINSKGISKLVVPEKYKEFLGIDYSFRDYFKIAKKYKKEIYSEVLFNYRPTGKEPKYETIAIITPLYDSNNKFHGVIFTDLDLDKISRRIQTELIANSTTKAGLYCIDYKKSKIIAGQNQKDISLEFKKFIISMSNSNNYIKTHTTINTFQNKKYFIAGSIIKNHAYSFDLIGIFPYNEAIALPAFYKQIIFLFSFIIIIIIMALIIFIHNQKIFRKLRRRIKTLEVDINEYEKKKAVAEVVDSEYFKTLQNKIETLKNI